MALAGVIVIILIIVIIVVVIRRSKTYKKEEAPEPTKVIIDQPPVYPNDPVELRRMQFSTPGKGLASFLVAILDICRNYCLMLE